MNNKNNQEKYINELNSIKAPDDLKNKTFEKMINNKKTKFYQNKYILSVAALLVICFGFTNLYLNNQIDTNSITNQETTIATIDKNAPNKFKNIDELKTILEDSKKSNTSYGTFDQYNSLESELKSEITSTIDKSTSTIDSTNQEENIQESNDYSKTNTQVENVDESDIVKTDGNYIYTLNNYNTLNITDVNSFSIISSISLSKIDNKEFNPLELYLKDNYLIVIGTYLEENSNTIVESNSYGDMILKDGSYSDIAYINYNTNIYTKAIVYDITDKQNPNKIRETAIEGNYISSRMLNNNIYLISNKSIVFNDQINDDELLPKYSENSNVKTIPITDILHFDDKSYDYYSYSYSLIGSFDLTSQDELNVETYFGPSGTIYMNDQNLYIATENYALNSGEGTDIRKFNIIDNKITYQCSNTIPGNINNQFSLDEYNNNLRIVTTKTNNTKSRYEIEKESTLYILDNNLNITGKLDNLGINEEVKSVRFIKNIAYVVTFQEIDPLFIIDLTDPTNPSLKGELKIPGFSSYLHPYDENHIIGIGYNTKTNSSGGGQKTTVKISMFDISDLENPTELFNNSVAYDDKNEYSNTLLEYNHKTLFYNKSKNLIGFPIEYYSNSTSANSKTGYAIFKINMDENKFEFNDNLLSNTSKIYYGNNQRLIYIGNNLYQITDTTIEKYNINDFSYIDKISIENNMNQEESQSIINDITY